MNKIILNHEMVLVVQQADSIIVKIRMRDGKWALQAPFEANQRGLIGAITLSLDVLAGKIMLTGIEAATPLNKALNSPKMIEIESGE